MEDTVMLEHPPERVRLGRILVAAGLIGWVAAAGHLVVTERLNLIIVALGFLSFATYFCGKTLLKARESRHSR